MTTRLELVLHAKGPADDEVTGWLIDVYLGQRLAAANLLLTNPLDKEQQRDSKWYIEQYAQESPYSLSRARDAAQALGGYAESILQQLGLSKLLEDEFSSSSNRVLSVEIVEASHEGPSVRTVHQLHWELLEDPATWGKEDLEIIVQRSIRTFSDSIRPVNRVQSWAHRADSSVSINMLLIVARDVTSNPAVYNDISPSMASSILARIWRDLKARASPIHLNIEIVRPGTFTAFREHLDRTERTRGLGYFHIVHFDLHGAVSRKGKQANLYFSSPDSDETEEVPAQDVAALLERFQLPFCVLNACESARANCGDDANIAKVFRAHSVKSVLAMSFKVSSSAAKLFLKVFYRELLVNQMSFSAAARSARKALRESPIRDARFGLERALVDYFVPVLYSSGEESVLVMPEAGTSEVGDSIDMERTNDSSVQLRGRDFDLLRLEKILLAQRTIYLHGVAGVGKSALLHYLRSLWLETAFVDAVVYIDFAEDKIHTVADLKETLLRQLLTATAETQLGPWTMTSPQSHDEQSFSDCIAEILSRHRTALIFDGLHASHTIFGPQGGVRSALSNSEINSFLRTLIAAQTLSDEYATFLIFAGRREDPEWLSEQLKHEFKDTVNVYHLRGLELAESMEFGLSVLRDVGQDVQKWGRPELDELELVVGTLQGISDSLLQVLPLAKSSGVPWLGFHDFLLRGIISRLSSSIWRELDDLCRSLPEDIFAPLMMLGMYWHEGPFQYSFTKGMISHKISNRKTLDLVYLLAQDRGFIKLGQYLDATWIHAQFTLYARTWARTEQQRRLAAPSSQSILGSLIQGVRNLVVSRIPEFLLHAGDRAQTASELLTAAVDLDPDALATQPAAKEFLSWFLGDSDERNITVDLLDAMNGIDYKQMQARYPTTFRNTLSCIDICLAAGEAIPLDKWPMVFLVTSTPKIRLVCTTAEAALFATRYEQLLEHFLKRVHGVAVEPEYQLFAMTVVNYLAATHRMEVSLPTTRFADYVRLATDIIEASEDKYGEMTDPMVVYQKGYTHRYRTVLELDDGSVEKAQMSWDKVLEIDERYLQLMENSNIQERIADMADTVETKELRDRMARYSRLSIPRAYIESRKEAMTAVIKAMVRIQKEGTTEKYPQSLVDAAEMSSFGLENITGVFADVGITGIEQDTRWWPEDLNVAAYLRKYDNPLQRLVEIESARDSGNCVRAAEHHRALMVSACENFDLDEVIEHLNALEKIYKSDPLFESALKENNLQKQTFKSLQSLYKSLSALRTGSSDTADQALDAMDNVINALGAQQVIPGGIRSVEIGRDLWKREMERDKSKLVEDSKDLAERCRRMMKPMFQLMMKNRHNPNFMLDLTAKVLEIQTLFQNIYNAETSGDFDTALQLIDRLEALSLTDVGRIALNPDDIRIHRGIDTRKLKWNNAVKAWGASMVDNDYDGARTHLDVMTSIQQSDSSEEPVAKDFTSLQRTTETFQWNHEFNAAQREQATNSTSARAHYDKLLVLHDAGGFSHVDQAELAGLVTAAKRNRLLTLVSAAMDTRDWQEAMTHLDAWLALRSTDLDADPRAHDNIRDLRENCEFHLHNDALITADRECRFADAVPHVEALRALFDRQQASPEVVRRLCPRMNAEMLEQMRGQVLAKKAMIDLYGEELGKDIILGIRETHGYRPAFRI